MTFDEQTIRSLLADQNITQGPLLHKGGQVGLGIFIDHLTDDLNKVLQTSRQADRLNAELLALKVKYEEDFGELEEELGRLVEACKHPSCHEHPDCDLVFVCNICGGHIEEGDDGF